MAHHFLPKKIGDWRLVDQVTDGNDVSVVYQYQDRDLYVTIEDRHGLTTCNMFVDVSEEPAFDGRELAELFWQVGAGMDISVTHVDEVYHGGLDMARLYIGLS